MRLPQLSSACLVMLSLMAAPLLAQEGAPPSVAPAAPLQPAAPSDGGAVLPSLPPIDAPSAQDGNVLPPAAPATAPSQEGQESPSSAPATAEGAAAPTPSAPDAPAQSTAQPAMPTPAASDAAHPAPHTDLYTIVMSSHWVVMSVMVLLVIATFAVLVILVHKIVEYALAFGRLRRSARALSKAQTLAEAELATRDHKGPAAEVLRAAAHEFSLAQADSRLMPGVRERTSGALARIEASAAQRLRAATGILASIGSLSPFIGLFGTVFGIMNSFLAIAESKTTNLAVVAPGIAEALFATAIGLAAAIPAVLVYNICARKLASYRNALGDIAAAAERLQSRDLDRLAASLKVER